ncbi:MAG: SDR family NAD(P)-dependent oxidoreductase [Gemmatimonadota bacterium]
MDGKVALITGASSGIGRATALEFAARGTAVGLMARREDELVALAAEIEAGGGRAVALRADVSVESDVEGAVASVVEAFGRFDFGVNNAGIEGEFPPITELTEEQWDSVLDINLKGTFLCIKHEARAMLEAGSGGAIVNVGSVNSFFGFAGGGPYASSKHGQVGLTTSASAELAPQGIRVNIVCPGFVDTAMHHRVRDLFGDEPIDGMIQAGVHQNRAGRAEEIAKAIAFLCSDDATYITGTTLTPDGGLTGTL